jgi:hypothetical protein
MEVPLIHGKTMLIDSEDYEKFKHLSMYPVTRHDLWYVQVSYARSKKQPIHRLILDAPKGTQVDHINGNGLDNRRCNLRIATHGQNQMNRRKQLKKSTSKYKGVSLNKKDGKWFAEIDYNGIHYHIGSFIDEVDAAKAYDEKARELFGEFARPNFGGI